MSTMEYVNINEIYQNVSQYKKLRDSALSDELFRSSPWSLI